MLEVFPDKDHKPKALYYVSIFPLSDVRKEQETKNSFPSFRTCKLYSLMDFTPVVKIPIFIFRDAGAYFSGEGGIT